MSQDGLRGHAQLAALAVADPVGALSQLLDTGASLSAHHRDSLRRVARLIADAFTTVGERASRSQMLEFLKSYGHLLLPAQVLEIVEVCRRDGAEEDLKAALNAAVEYAPTHAGLLQAAAETAVAANDAAQARDLLTRLGRADSSLATVEWVYRTRQRIQHSEDPGVRIALLGSYTVDPLVPYVDLECRALKLEPEVYVAPFNTWHRETLGQGSRLESFAPHIAFLAVSIDDLVPELVADTASVELRATGEQAVGRLLTAAAQFASWSAALLVVHSLHSVFRDPLGPAAGRSAPGRTEVLNGLNAALAEGLRGLPRTYMLDVGDVIARRGHGGFDNPKMRHLASMRLSEHALGDVARAYAGFIAPLMGRTRKCVVVDLDNTLWGGIVGEDGPHGIRLGKTSPGSEYREFQHYLLSLTRRGVLLAINSKNNAADALEVVRSHDEMILREGAFSAMRINWESKAKNLISIAEELSLGLDAFVFVDDSDKERALMRQALPQVLTPEMPRDPALYREVLERMPELHVLTVTDEDRSRTQQYAERRLREDLRSQAQTPDEYLKSLGIVVMTNVVSEKALPRVHQLFQRTNQFNLTGRRYELGALSAWASDSAWRVYTSHVSDRFGDHGLVASAVVRVAPEAWTIDNFVMSCRVIGYGVEDALLARIGTDAYAASAQELLGEFTATAKNAPAQDFFSKNTFVRDANTSAPELWKRPLTGNTMKAPLWVTVREADET